MKSLADAAIAFLEADSQESAQGALNELNRMGPGAKRANLDAAAAVFTRALAEIPPPASAQLALLVGTLIEWGADPLAHSRPLLDLCGTAFAGTAQFMLAMKERIAPDASEEDLEAAMAALAEESPEIVGAQMVLPEVCLAAIASLSRSPEARALARSDAKLLETASAFAEMGGNVQFLAKMLHVLDDEELIVLHPESGLGWRVVVAGIPDNFQLHTLLAAELCPRGLPGKLPSKAAIRCARGEGPQQVSETTEGTFNLYNWIAVRPDGTLPPASDKTGVDPHLAWIWNEGVPADIWPFEGKRHVVLGPPAYARTWAVTRLFPVMPATCKVTGELSKDEVKKTLATLGKAPRPKEPHPRHGGP